MRLVFHMLLLTIVMALSAVMPSVAAEAHCKQPATRHVQMDPARSHAASMHHHDNEGSRPDDQQQAADCAWRCLSACAGIMTIGPSGIAAPIAPPRRYGIIPGYRLEGLAARPLLHPPKPAFV